MPEIISWDENKDGALSTEAMQHKMLSLGYRATQYNYPPGCDFPEHTHSFDKLDGVLCGQFEIQIKGRTVLLQAGDMIYIPAHELHAAKVMGNQAVISLDGVK